MKIAIIVLHLKHGGVEKSITELSNALIEIGHNVHVFSIYNFGVPAYEFNNEVEITYLINRLPNRERFLKAFKKKKIYNIVREGISAVKTLYLKKKSVVLLLKNMEEFDAVITTRHEHNMLLSKFNSSNYLKIGQLHHDTLPGSKINKQIKNGYRNLDVITTLTDEHALEIRELLNDSERSPLVKCVPNFIPDNTFKDTDVNKLFISRAEKEIKTLVSIGRLEYEKGFDRILEIWNKLHIKHPDWNLKIVGDGSEREKLDSFIMKNDLTNNVEMLGFQTSNEVMSILENSDVFVLASRTEGLGIVLIEASSKFLPLIAFDVRTGPRSIIIDGVNGFLIPDEDFNLYVEKLDKIISNEKLRYDMSLSSYNLGKRFMKSKVMNIWKDILK